jgi:hypothetical protein
MGQNPITPAGKTADETNVSLEKHGDGKLIGIFRPIWQNPGK